MEKLGSKGEKIAVEFLKKQGYKVLACNYKLPIGEIDIIAVDQGAIVFIEVKTRKGGSFGLPFEAVNFRKRKKLKDLALLYLKKFKMQCPARFDVLSIYVQEGREEIEHIKDAFEL